MQKSIYQQQVSIIVPWRYERHALPLLRHVGRVGVFIPTFYSSHVLKLYQSHYFTISFTLKRSLCCSISPILLVGNYPDNKPPQMLQQ
jgi:hypothetical protein